MDTNILLSEKERDVLDNVETLVKELKNQLNMKDMKIAELREECNSKILEIFTMKGNLVKVRDNYEEQIKQLQIELKRQVKLKLCVSG